ncbi:phosphoribosylamine--glycine ligase [Candidatus Roizmanbacteria bacterium RIFCSPLOWO2_01_FULL_38_12]|uniref:Phosphoribosylamine--glycine ligase n=1 Tax=Candidatus Roizmanbacteria bacterium RIFCSPLOWO2_01_FULL_38_12 TaxID=1802061 RepID=A0A1F7IZZ4_9BACT|nr:MAG: phosphoribosylamine--glycine ligase [Candidatus Roizmanbacteria bacterium RIFCSPHIGHO2_01_FULL_38_15]OGK48929.1 MAG: phosphoribosylamine--glycine ligase [Candidatus Roizmanbacteria bacterium RIFCSPLOWO2_01_FULL_38_12]
MKKNILIIGGGGREHAIGWKLKQSKKVDKLYFAPGNAGTSEIGENIPANILDHQEIVNFAKINLIDMVVVAPEDPLAAGMVDSLNQAGIRAFGPTKNAAQLESSKAFAKDLMKKAGIPTAKFENFSDYKSALKYLSKQQTPIVIKASGLAFGKGVVVAQTMSEAKKALKNIMLDKQHGDAGNTVVIEEYLYGQEISIHAFCDGKTASLFPTSQDHKQIFDHDKGPNTGGMGTIAPVPWVKKNLIEEINKIVVMPILKELQKRHIEYKGCLYPGIMVTEAGIKVLEFNCRFGDPETEPYLRLLKTDLYDIFNACIDGKLKNIKIRWSNQSACCIVLSSRGYPQSSQKDVPISGISDADLQKDVVVFHAATKKQDSGVATNGGRVLAVSATGKTLKYALNKAYKAVKKINFGGMQYRKDIGLRKKPSFV